jgi:hypothetical protein
MSSSALIVMLHPLWVNVCISPDSITSTFEPGDRVYTKLCDRGQRNLSVWVIRIVHPLKRFIQLGFVDAAGGRDQRAGDYERAHYKRL